jgi:putative thioredoxin
MEIEVNDNNFDKKVIEKSKEIPVVVDFWAEWCGPCVMLKPVLEKLAEEYDKKFILAKAKTEDNRKHAIKFGVVSIPNVKMFKNGNIVDEFIGFKSEQEVREWLERNMK